MSDFSAIKKYTDVVTSDGEQLGEALALHHRQEDIDPNLKLYATYLEVYSLEMGNASYVPTDFIAPYSSGDDQVTLAVNRATFSRETWDRTPDFIAARRSQKETLPSGEQAALI